MEPLVCIANIGPRQRRVRLRFGIVMAGVTVAALSAAYLLALPRTARLVAFLPAWMAALGIFQYLEKT